MRRAGIARPLLLRNADAGDATRRAERHAATWVPMERAWVWHVGIARAGFHLPYFRASMSMERVRDEVRYASRRRAKEGAFAGSYAPTGPVKPVQPGSLEEFLTERYCLYSANRKGRLFRGEIHHAPWPLQPARFDLRSNTMAAQLGLELPASEAIGHYAERLDVVAWGLDPI